MRRGTVIFLVINLIVIGFLLNACSTLISLLFEDGAADAIARAEIPAPGSELIDNRTQLIPKIIHQTYINESIPARWKAGQQSCIDLHEDYEYIVRPLTSQSQYRSEKVKNAKLTNPALDRRQIPRIHQSRIPLVPRNLRQLPIPNPTRRLDPLFRADLLWRNIYRPRRRLQSTSRSPALLLSLVAPHRTNRDFQRRHGRRASTPILLENDRLPTVLQPLLVYAVHHSHVLYRPALSLRDMERIYRSLPPGRRSRTPLNAA